MFELEESGVAKKGKMMILFLAVAIRVALSVEITQPPSSVNVSLNSTATFTCQGIGDAIAFRVDDVLASNPSITSRGFDQEDEVASGQLIMRSLSAIAYKENNNTNVNCIVTLSVPPYGGDASPSAVLMIQGILDGVGDLMATVIDGSNVSLTWTPPYSLDNVPITGYNIITSDGINITVNTTYHILSSSDPNPCNITTVSVGAINDVGTSQYNNVSFYYQRVSAEVDVSIIGLSQVTLFVAVNISKLCVGEHPNSITINVIYSNDVVSTTNISSIPMDQLTINHTVTLHNDWIEYFIVNVTLSNTAGEASYSFPLGHVGPVNNIRSSSTDCSTININWSKPSVHNRVNIHNYTLLVYRDDAELIRTHTVNGSTTSYQFVDDDLFNHEYTYVIYGSNELGEGDYSNGTFSYLKVPESVRNDTTLTLLDDNNTLHFNIPIIKFNCINVLPVNINVSIHCDNTVVYSDGRVINAVNPTVALSDNITILPSQYESCQLFITLTSTNGISDSYNISIDIPQVIPTTITTSNLPSANVIIAIAALAIVVVVILISIAVVSLTVLMIMYILKLKSGNPSVNPPHIVTVSNESYSTVVLTSSLPTTTNPAYEHTTIFNNEPDYDIIR